MKTIFKITSAILMLAATAIAQDSWTLKNGDASELELMRTSEEDGVIAGEFRDMAGKTVFIKESEFVEADAKRLREFVAPEPQAFPLIDAAVAKLRDGKQPTAEEIAECEAEKSAYYKELSEKYGTVNNTRFGWRAQADVYIVMIKMALLDFPQHGGWPFRSDLRFLVHHELRVRTETSEDPFLHFCAIFPSYSRGNVDHAIACYKMIQKNDPFLAKIAVDWANRLPESDNREKLKNAMKEE